MTAQTFTVFDLETTGLFARGTDRIVEIALVTLDREGEVVDRWETIVNPQRDLGPQHIHRLTAAEVRRAPTFEDIADEVAYRLDGSVLVAHNLRFDGPFLQHEFRRAGQDAPDAILDVGLCTLNLALELELPRPFTLAGLCELLSIVNHAPHSAGGDAQATAELLRRYLDLDPEREDWDASLTAAAALARTLVRPVCSVAAAVRTPLGTASEPTHFLDRIAAVAAPRASEAGAEEYFDLLSRILLDRLISETEAEALASFAETTGLSRSDCVGLNEEYVVALTETAAADGVITPDEHDELTGVAELLSIAPQRRDQLFARGEHRHTEAVADAAARPTEPANARQRIVPPGSRVVLTGSMSRPRTDIATDLGAAGYDVASGVTKKVDLVVAADPDSMSGKAEKARKYGIPVVGEPFVVELLS